MSGASAPTDNAHRADINRPMITIAIMLATLIVSIDGTIANVALPHMQGSLNASQDQITWVLTSFIVATAIATPVTGWLSDRFGSKQVFLASVLGFTVASMLCGVAGSLMEIVGARLLQGLFGAALVPLSQSTLLDINPREKHGSAMAVWGMGVMVGPIVGPTLGGWLTDAYDWRWCFFINVPIGAAAFLGVLKFIPHQVARRSIRFD
ncbi:MAG: DHA2 family efflux MFS transporter permease subunit, partial [Asticcacaulis sp.]|uniref:DHA2 family efflux MFS transporter permease subunit n=1 Tax=Asticcacaulis sp. TaxID=1872648 RepID=UPI003F7C310A